MYLPEGFIFRTFFSCELRRFSPSEKLTVERRCSSKVQLAGLVLAPSVCDLRGAAVGTFQTVQIGLDSWKSVYLVYNGA